LNKDKIGVKNVFKGAYSSALVYLLPHTILFGLIISSFPDRIISIVIILVFTSLFRIYVKEVKESVEQ